VIVPIGHDQSIRRWPWVTISIIGLCTLATLLDVSIADWGYHTRSGLSATLVTSAFIHGGWGHLIGNMLFLWLAGAAVEDLVGPIKFAIFYIAGAVAATACFAALHTGHETVVIGASGAISAVMGAFLVYFTSTQIRFWYWLWFRSGTFETAAYVALPLWLAEQFLWRSIEGPSQYSGVAYEAHIGGFAFGVGIALAAKKMWKPAERTAEPPPASYERFDRCMAAIAARDLGTVRTLASRVVLDLSREYDHSRVLDVYLALKTLPQRPLTDGAFAACARAAEAVGNLELRDEIIAELKSVHPGSALARQR
jgi:membrane associated rhomboid family serine protease